MSKLYSLEKLGLTKNEIQIYRFLLRNSSSSAKEIIDGLNMDKSSVYRALESLQESNLVEIGGVRRNQVYHPNNPKELNKIYKEKVRELKKAKSDIDLFIEDIDKYAQENYKQNNIQVFEGAEGYRAWMYQRLNGTHKIIKELGTRDVLQRLDQNYYTFMDEFIPKRIEKCIRVHSIIFSSNEDPDHLDRTNEEMNKEVRQYTKGKFDLGAYFTVFGDMLGYYSTWDNKVIGIYINDRFISNLADKMFEVIWGNSEIVI